MQASGVIARESTPGLNAGAPSRFSAPLGYAILVLIGALLVEVLAEGWLVTWFGVRGVDSDGVVVVDPAQWPKAVKNGLYCLLFVLTSAKFTLDRAWRGLTTKADLALVVLAAVMVIAGLFGGSSAVLIGQALFVYLRGVIVFYALRAVRPSYREVKPLLWIGGVVVALNVLLGIWQFLVGRTGYTSLGWVDLQWAGENRAQGLLDHPNNLGHVSGFMLLGLVAWFVSVDRVKARWWVLFVLVAVGLSVAQSRQSMAAAMIAIAVVAFVRRGRFKALIAAAVTVAVLSTLPAAFSQQNRRELAYRLGGLFNALHMSGGEDSRRECAGNPACEGTDGEIRVLFVKQGMRLWAASPLLGYGAGQFGGIVAVKHDRAWNRDPRFQAVLGAEGFFLHGFKSTSVDVFWLHLLVELGLIGLAAYLVWLFLVGLPLWRYAWHRGGRTGRRRQAVAPDRAVVVWSVATLVFAVLIAAWSPSLEDPLFPPLMFLVLGTGWVLASVTRSRAEGA